MDGDEPAYRYVNVLYFNARSNIKSKVTPIRVPLSYFGMPVSNLEMTLRDSMDHFQLHPDDASFEWWTVSTLPHTTHFMSKFLTFVY